MRKEINSLWESHLCGNHFTKCGLCPGRKWLNIFFVDNLWRKFQNQGLNYFFKKNLSFSLSVFVWVCVRLCVCPCECGILLPCCVWRIENKLGHQFLPSLFEMGLSFTAKYVRLGSSRAAGNILVCLHLALEPWSYSYRCTWVLRLWVQGFHSRGKCFT